MDGELEAVDPETQSPVSGVRSDLTQLGITEKAPVTRATLVMNHEMAPRVINMAVSCLSLNIK